MPLPLPRCDEQSALRAIDRLRAAHPRGDSIAAVLEHAVQQGRISEEGFIQHSRWCNTGGSWSSGIDPARKAAMAMYGFVPPRLIGEDGRTDSELDRLLGECRRRLSG